MKRKYTKDEKSSLLKEYLASGLRPAQFCRVHGLRYETFRCWRREHGLTASDNLSTMPNHDMPPIESDLHDELARLRREKKQLELELQRTKWKLQASELMIDLAESTYHIPVRKNSGAK